MFLPVRLLCFRLGLPILLLSPAGDAQNTPRAAVFSSNARMVLVPFTVTGHDAKTVMGLQAKDFKVFDDQAPQEIVSFATEDAPCSVGLVLDISGSMQTTLGIVKDGAGRFVRSANQDDEFMLLTISTLPASGPRFTPASEDLEEQIAFTRSGGLTALIDTVYLGLNQMRKAGLPRRALLILSDGIDNHSRYSVSELLRVALEADVQTYSIIIDNGASGNTATIPYRPTMIQKPGDRAAQTQGPELLEKLADKTGGLHFHVRNEAEIREAVTKAGEALRNEYVIGYRMPPSGPAGKWHRIRVKTTAPKVIVHARSGYYAP